MTSVKTHRFPCGAVAAETTRDFGDVSVTKCVGPIPDEFRTMHYGPVTHPELPDGGGSDAGFAEFVNALRDASEEDAPAIVAGAAIR